MARDGCGLSGIGGFEVKWRVPVWHSLFNKERKMAISRIRSGRKEGNYRVRIQPIDEKTGKAISVPSRVVPTRLEAQKVERQMWNEYYEGKFTPKASLDFAQALKDYCDGEYSAGRWNDVTYYDWQYTYRLIAEYFNKIKIRDVDENKIRAFARNYISTHKRAGVSRHSTVDKRLQHLRGYFEMLREEGIVQRNPVPKNALKKFFRVDEFSISSEKYIFSNDEVVSLKERIVNDLYGLPVSFWGSRIAILIALDTGMRPQEIQAVKWNQLVHDGSFEVFKINDSWSEKLNRLNGHLKARARGVSRLTLNLSSEVLGVLRIYSIKQRHFLEQKRIVNKNDFIVLNCRNTRLMKAGIPLGQRSMNDLLQNLCRELGIGDEGEQISMYTCRHTVASKLGNTPGMSYPWAAARMGHSLNMFMKTYVHPENDKSETMMNLMNQDSSMGLNLKSM
ncbi:MAG: site-specific integrase [Lactobacillus sp.]|nr:site-specific integrase [Lactobacillus sp.]